MPLQSAESCLVSPLACPVARQPPQHDESCFRLVCQSDVSAVAKAPTSCSSSEAAQRWSKGLYATDFLAGQPTRS